MSGDGAGGSGAGGGLGRPRSFSRHSNSKEHHHYFVQKLMQLDHELELKRQDQALFKRYQPPRLTCTSSYGLTDGIRGLTVPPVTKIW